MVKGRTHSEEFQLVNNHLLGNNVLVQIPTSHNGNGNKHVQASTGLFFFFETHSNSSKRNEDVFYYV